MPSPTFQKREMTRERVGVEIRDAEDVLAEDGARGLNLWTRIRVEPLLWAAVVFMTLSGIDEGGMG